MSIQLVAKISAVWVPDGVGAMSVKSAQKLDVVVDFPPNANLGPILVPGGNTPSAANITTALNSLASAVTAIMGNTVNLAIIDGWVTGSA